MTAQEEITLREPGVGIELLPKGTITNLVDRTVKGRTNMRYKIINLAGSQRWSRMAVISAALIMTLTTSGWGQTTVVVGSTATAAATSAGLPSTGPFGLNLLGVRIKVLPLACMAIAVMSIQISKARQALFLGGPT